MEITARKKSDDPVQEALRSHKDKWNLAAKEFIKRVISFKKALNGRGDPKYGLPISSIKDPLPNEIGSFLKELSNNYQTLAEEALKIQQEQASYSQTRKKPQPKSEAPIQEPAAPATQPVGQEAPKTASLRKIASKESYLSIGNQFLPTLLAITAEEQQQGLMYRDWPPPVMSFVYSAPSINRFWMHNTPSPLDIVFSLKGEVTSIHKGEPYSTKLIGDYKFSDLVVELPYGTCKKLGIVIGDSIQLIEDADNNLILENK
jgi:uncharacterized membrane protein (UPF0127 family)